jgi:hypothetical protein
VLSVAIAVAALFVYRYTRQAPAPSDTPPAPTAASPQAAAPPREPSRPAPAAPEPKAEPAPAPAQREPAPPNTTDRNARVEEQLRGHRQRARELLAAGEPLRALAALRSALELRPDDQGSRALLGELAAGARTALQQARREAQGRNAEQLAAQTFVSAAALEADGDEERRAGRLDGAVQLWLRARDMFSAAADQAGRAAAVQRERERTAAAAPAAPPAVPPGDTATAPPAPVPRPSPPTESPVSPADAERPAILRTLSAYEQAWASLDASAIGRVHQLSASEMATVRNSVEAARRIEVVVAVQNVRVSPDGRQAFVAAAVRRTFIPKSAARPSNTTVNTVFTMEKRGDAWVIVALR